MRHVHRLNFISIGFGSIGIIAVALLLTLSLVAQGQVNGLGPSDPNLFDNVIDVPNDQPSISGVIGGNGMSTQVNVSSGGTFEFPVEFNALSELNINNGTFDLSSSILAQSGGEVNVTGGTVNGMIVGSDNSFVNVSGGFVNEISTDRTAILNIFDGEVDEFRSNGGVVNISGGIVGGDFFARRRSEINNGGTLNISGGVVNNVDVNSGFLAELIPELNLSGGSLAAASIESGRLNITGGTVGRAVLARIVNVFGNQFSINGVAVGPLGIDESFQVDISQRVILAGVFEDGTRFEVAAADTDASDFSGDLTVISQLNLVWRCPGTKQHDTVDAL